MHNSNKTFKALLNFYGITLTTRRDTKGTKGIVCLASGFIRNKTKSPSKIRPPRPNNF